MVFGKIYQRSGYAIGGYDTVAYFIENKPTKGDDTIAYKYKGATWLFSKKKHKDLFIKNPDKYTPAFGGHCAYAMWNDYIASTSPHAWTIKGGRLFLNYSRSIRGAWEKGGQRAIHKGDKNWAARNYKY